MKKIPLSQGKFALVDDCYYKQLVAMGSWHYNTRNRVAIHTKTKQLMSRVVCRLAGKHPASRVLRRGGNSLNNQIDNLLITVEDRFWSRVERCGECWNWLGRTTDGYGHMSINGKEVLSHRLAYQFSVGLIPSGLAVLHTCDNPSCCNPKHLWLGTRADNNKDRALKGRSADYRGEKPERDSH